MKTEPIETSLPDALESLALTPLREMLSRAAELRGQSEPVFFVSALSEAATQVIAEHEGPAEDLQTEGHGAQ